MTVLLLFGGMSNEHLISCQSAAALLSPLQTLGHRVHLVGITHTGEWRLYTGSPSYMIDGTWQSRGAYESLLLAPPRTIYTHTGRPLRFDVAIPCIHGQYGEDGVIQGLLSALSIPYIGCGIEASVLSMNKALAKTLVAKQGIPTLPFIPLKRGAPIPDIPLPAFCKACRSGSSIGTATCIHPEDILGACEIACSVDGDGMAEPYLSAREIEVGIFDDGERIVSYPGEITTESEYYDYAAKYEKDSSHVDTRAHIPQKIADEAMHLASRIFDALGCRHLSRVDFFLTGDTLYFNEINTFPGLTPHSLYPRMMEAAGMPLPTLLDRLLRSAL